MQAQHNASSNAKEERENMIGETESRKVRERGRSTEKKGGERKGKKKIRNI